MHAGLPLVIGRAFPADVVLDDLSLSRQHARVGWHQGQLWIEDLGSTNGTHVRGERISSRIAFAPGETVQLGAATASVNVTVSADALMRGVIAHERFLSRIEDEVVRARTSELPVVPLEIDEEGIDLDQTIADLERRLIEAALRKANGVRRRTAVLLGITMRSLRYRLEKLGIEMRGSDDG